MPNKSNEPDCCRRGNRSSDIGNGCYPARVTRSVSLLLPAERNQSAMAAFGRMNRRPTRMWGISPLRSALRVDLSLKPRSSANAATDRYVLSPLLVTGPDGTSRILCPIRHPQRRPLRGKSAVWWNCLLTIYAEHPKTVRYCQRSGAPARPEVSDNLFSCLHERLRDYTDRLIRTICHVKNHNNENSPFSVMEGTQATFAAIPRRVTHWCVAAGSPPRPSLRTGSGSRCCPPEPVWTRTRYFPLARPAPFVPPCVTSSLSDRLAFTGSPPHDRSHQAARRWSSVQRFATEISATCVFSKSSRSQHRSLTLRVTRSSWRRWLRAVAGVDQPQEIPQT